MMDVTVFSKLSGRLCVPHCAQNGTWDTEIYICNPNDTVADVGIAVIDKSGVTIGASNHALAANGSGQFRLADLLPSDHERGSVEISCAQGIAAFARYDNLKTSGGMSFAGIGAVEAGF